MILYKNRKLWIEIVAPDRALSTAQVELFYI